MKQHCASTTQAFKTIGMALIVFFSAGIATSQPMNNGLDEDTSEVMVSLDFDNVELSEVIDLIAQLTNKNFIYDDRVRGRVTIVSPTEVSIEQAYAVFESVLQVKGFTTVESPGGAIKVIPIREAKESNIDTESGGQPPEDRDRFVTRLIPLKFIEAEGIVNTLKPLVSKDASMAAYAPTNTVILTESSSNIRRLISILQSIDVVTNRESLSVIKVEYADAATMAEQISEIYGAETSARAPARGRRASNRATAAAAAAQARGGLLGSRVRIITDERTNSLIILAPKGLLTDLRGLVAQLDVPVTGGGRIHVYYLKNANAEELANTLNALISGQPQGGQTQAGAGQAQALRVQVSGLSEGISITADPATNSLVIQASQEGFAALSQVITKLDRERPQVLVEALIAEVTISDGMSLGFSGVLRLVNGDAQFGFESLTGGALDALTNAATSDAAAAAAAGAGAAAAGPPGALAGQSGAGFIKRTFTTDSNGNPTSDGYSVAAIISAAASNGGINILSAPHILTSDNEQAEIRVGDNIPIITSRVQSAQGQVAGLSSSVNVERQDIGVTLRVTPQITEGNQLRLDIFQEITDVNTALTAGFGDNAAENVGVALSSRKIENTVVVGDGDTVVIGGLISDVLDETVTRVPWLGDIPILGWAFKTTKQTTRKVNLLVFLTPHVIRNVDDLIAASIKKRDQFRRASDDNRYLTLDEMEAESEAIRRAQETGIPYEATTRQYPVRHALNAHEAEYPLDRMRAIEREQSERQEGGGTTSQKSDSAPPSYFVKAAVYGDSDSASDMLTKLIDAGYDGTVVAEDAGSGIVLYEVLLGPYEGAENAKSVASTIRQSHKLAPTIILDTAEDQ
ncbi:type II secretion system secretin GspD [Myxococcota bacterium]|nr:type II secretion system secretin GspD [Myxococcota bacterium]